MKEAYIYFGGNLVSVVKCEKVDTDCVKDNIALVIGNTKADYTIAALVPITHLIVIREKQ